MARSITNLNLEVQNYKGIQLQLIERYDYHVKGAKRYVIKAGNPKAADNQNVWIPNKHTEENGTIRLGENLDYIFFKAQRQLELAGYRMWFIQI